MRTQLRLEREIMSWRITYVAFAGRKQGASWVVVVVNGTKKKTNRLRYPCSCHVVEIGACFGRRKKR